MTNIYVEKLNSAGYTISVYTISNLGSFAPQYDSPVSPMPLPQNDDTQNVLIKIEGNSTQITISWKMKDQTPNGNNTTPSSANSGFVTVSTIDTSLPLTPFQQLAWLKKCLVPTQITDRYRLTVADTIKMGNTSVSNGITVYNVVFGGQLYQELGTVTKLAPTMTGDSPLAFDASLTFMVGNVVSAYEVNTPSSPQNLTISQGSAGILNLGWAAPIDTAGGVTGYKIYRKTLYTPYILINSPAAGSTSYSDTGLVTGTTYYYTIYAINSNGLGGPSAEISLNAP